jgi:hypothetical protein
VVLLKLARAMRLPLADANLLLRAGGFAAAYPRRSLDDAALAPVREALQRHLDHHEPYPACVVDRASHLLMSNRAFERVMALLPEADTLWQRSCGEEPRNVLLLTLHPQGLRPHLVNPEEVVPALLDRAAREAVVDAEAARVLRLARELAGPVASLAEPPASGPLLCERYAIGTLQLNLFVMLSCFGTPMDETTDLLRIESFFPADAASEQLLRALAGGEGARSR